MDKILLFLFIAFISFQTADAQKKGAHTAKPAADSILTDTFSGNIPDGGVVYATFLTLNHCRYCDMGKYSFVAVPRGSNSQKSAMVEGEWTVLRGDAKDENATVVELDDKAGKPLYYYLRVKNGDLQQLDSLLKEIKPAKDHMLKKQ